jgi:hypothetical protein
MKTNFSHAKAQGREEWKLFPRLAALREILT